MNKILLCDMADLYQTYEFYREYNYDIIGFADLSGINGYLDDEAREVICRRLGNSQNYRIRFLDNGNFHYMSYILMQDMQKEFDLILVDRHPDCKAATFGDLLSCGSWVKKALEDYPLLKRVYMVGVNPELHGELEDLGDLQDRVHIVEDISFFRDNAINDNVYISIDKDALSEEFASCIWDQGQMTLEQLFEIMKYLSESCNIDYFDICGEGYNDPYRSDITLNDRSNAEIVSFINNL